MKQIIIAAPHSGSGKTTLTLGIMAALRSRGLRVAPFKVGPDFIDPGYHRLVTGSPSVNLDGWICGHEFIRATFAHHAAGADIAVIEGVMGLFDGIDGVSDAGSTAEVAKLLGAPVILVVDARSQARSAAALVHGFASFDAKVSIAGVIFNNVASANHERVLRDALSASCPGVAVLGCVPRDAALAIPSRHLGLMTAEENPLSEAFLAHLCEVVDQHLDLEAIIGLSDSDHVHTVHNVHQVHNLHQAAPATGDTGAGSAPATSGTGAVSTPATPATGAVSTVPPVKIAVARDAAFCFVYQDNLRLMAECGAELCYFSPLLDSALPPQVSGIYLPGGYPELFAAKLAGNGPLKAAIRAAVEADMPVYAECGGFIYLTGGVAADDNVLHPFVGIFPVQTRMLPRRKALGYREVKLLTDSVIGAKGSIARGHEFHYSEMEEMPPEVERLYAVTRKGVALGPEGYSYKNCLASYIHLHFGSSPDIADSFVKQCKAYRTGSLT